MRFFLDENFPKTTTIIFHSQKPHSEALEPLEY